MPDAHSLTRHCRVSAAIGNSAILGSKYDISAPTNRDILRYVRVEAVHFIGSYVSDRRTSRYIRWIFREFHSIGSWNRCEAPSRYRGKRDNDADPCQLVHVASIS
jgi:hypothetical protein